MAIEWHVKCGNGKLRTQMGLINIWGLRFYESAYSGVLDGILAYRM